MNLDSRTIVIAHFILSLFCVVIAWATYRAGQKMQQRGPGLWFVGFALISFGLLAVGLRGILPNFITVFVGNGCLYFGIVLHAQGVWRFIGRKFNPALAWSLAGLVSITHGVIFALGASTQVRAALFAGFFVVVNLFSALGLYLLAEPKLRKVARISALFYFMAVVLYILRLIAVLAMPESHWLSGGLIEGIYLLASMIIFVGMAFAELQLLNGLLVSDREAAAADKELLLKEMHHRTKNNLQLTSALVELESDRFTDPLIKASLAAIDARIRSIGLLHEQLSTIDAGDDHLQIDQYLSEILAVLVVGQANIKLETDLAAVRVPLAMALPLGLIVNELVTNALKYAFAPAEAGKLLVSLAQRDQDLELVVADSGKGMELDTSGGLGTMIVQSFVKQLGGTLQYDRHSGTVVRITVPIR